MFDIVKATNYIRTYTYSRETNFSCELALLKNYSKFFKLNPKLYEALTPKLSPTVRYPCNFN